MRAFFFLYLFLTISADSKLFAQVGIGTNNPATGVLLDVNGNVRIRDLSATAKSLTGNTATGLLRRTELGAGLISESTTQEIRTTASILSLGRLDLGTATVISELDLALDGANKDIIFFTLTSSGGAVTIHGIKGGTHGRRIILYSSDNALELRELSTSTSETSKIYTLGQGQGLATTGPGMFELFYDGGAVGGGKWVVVKFNI